MNKNYIIIAFFVLIGINFAQSKNILNVSDFKIKAQNKSIYDSKLMGSFTNSNSDFRSNQIIYFEDFEQGNNGWTSIVLDSIGNESSTWELTFDDSLNSNSYLSQESKITQPREFFYDALVSPNISIPDTATNVKLKFDFLTNFGDWENLEFIDFWYLEVSSNNQEWYFFSDYIFVGINDEWITFPDAFQGFADFNLGIFAGEEIKIRIIAVYSNGNNYSSSLQIDNVALVVGEDFNPNCTDDIYEPNNSIATAFPIEIGQQIENSILCDINDLDFFSFNIDAATYLDFNFEGPFYVSSYIIDEDGNYIYNNYIHYDLSVYLEKAGKYYIVFENYFSDSPIQYSFKLNTVNAAPNILSVEDVPNDQGLQVRVKWQSSVFDPIEGYTYIDNYSLWRKVNPNSSRLIDSEIIELQKLAPIEDNPNSIYKFNNDYYDFIASIPAVENRPFENYSYVAPTLEDSVETTFVVSAIPLNGYSLPTMWGSEGSGFSSDNVAPEFRTYSLSLMNNGVKLNWDVDLNYHHDVKNFSVYRHTELNFNPNESNLIGVLDHNSKEHFDLSVDLTKTYYYIIKVSDKTGHTAITPVLSTDGSITSVSELNVEIPDEYNLAQNYPNPFNPTTVIRFAIPQSSFVSLKVYDILGNEVAEIVNNELQAGYYNYEFDASRFSSGLYIYRLQTNDFIQTKKMMLIK